MVTTDSSIADRIKQGRQRLRELTRSQGLTYDRDLVAEELRQVNSHDRTAVATHWLETVKRRLEDEKSDYSGWKSQAIEGKIGSIERLIKTVDANDRQSWDSTERFLAPTQNHNEWDGAYTDAYQLARKYFSNSATVDPQLREWITSETDLTGDSLEGMIEDLSQGMQLTRITSGFIKPGVYEISNADGPQKFIYTMHNKLGQTPMAENINKIFDGDLGDFSPHTFTSLSHYDDGDVSLLAVTPVTPTQKISPLELPQTLSPKEYMEILEKFHRNVGEKVSELEIDLPDIWDGTDTIAVDQVMDAARANYGEDLDLKDIEQTIKVARTLKETYYLISKSNPLVAVHGDFKAPLQYHDQEGNLIYSEEGNLLGDAVFDYDQMSKGRPSRDISVCAATLQTPVSELDALTRAYLNKSTLSDRDKQETLDEMPLAAAVGYANRMEKFLLSRPNNVATKDIINFYNTSAKHLIAKEGADKPAHYQFAA